MDRMVSFKLALIQQAVDEGQSGYSGGVKTPKSFRAALPWSPRRSFCCAQGVLVFSSPPASLAALRPMDGLRGLSRELSPCRIRPKPWIGSLQSPGGLGRAAAWCKAAGAARSLLVRQQVGIMSLIEPDRRLEGIHLQQGFLLHGVWRVPGPRGLDHPCGRRRSLVPGLR
jgi:hypothetical protein